MGASPLVVVNSAHVESSTNAATPFGARQS
jgi:hypothetical protein